MKHNTPPLKLRSTKKKKGQKRKIAIAIAVSIVVLCIAGMISGGYWLVYTAGSDGALRTWIVQHLPVSVAKVEGQRILLRDFEQRASDMNYFYDQQEQYELGLVDRPSQDHLKEQMLEQMINTALLENIAEEYEVSVSDEELEQYYRDVIVPQEPRGESVLEEDLEKFYGWTPKEFQKNELYPVVLRNKIMEALREDTLINEEPLAKATDIRNQIDGEPSKPFSEFATQYSQDKETAENGGMIGFISKGQYDEHFEEAAFALEVGEVSQPVRSDIGYHIIKVTDKDEDADTVEVRHILIKTQSVDDLLEEEKDDASIKKNIPR